MLHQCCNIQQSVPKSEVTFQPQKKRTYEFTFSIDTRKSECRCKYVLLAEGLSHTKNARKIHNNENLENWSLLCLKLV